MRLTDDFTAPEAGLMGKFNLHLFSSNLQWSVLFSVGSDVHFEAQWERCKK